VVVPVRVPTQTKDASGKPLQLDLTFLKSGSTTRDNVTKNLTAIDTGINESRLFWGRWDSSKWRSTAVGLVPPEGDRIWRAHNLLVQFDPNGIVKNWAIVDDGKLGPQLDVFDYVDSETMLDFSSPVRAEVQIPYYRDMMADIVLSADFIEYSITTRSSPYVSRLKTARTNILRISPTPGAAYNGPVSGMVPFAKPNLIVATVYFAEPAVVHYGEKGHSAKKKLKLGLDPATFLLLRRYISQTKHDAVSTGFLGDKKSVSTSPNIFAFSARRGA
jgi:hypothetical protein